MRVYDGVEAHFVYFGAHGYNPPLCKSNAWQSCEHHNGQ
ncbi:hypothetical protein [Klebsiella pneumoniae IS39]|uniref:Uncharacterized protein n=2 Tax=Enterobacteriaceae TaxID=543 RepID=A0A0E3MRU3_ECOLX|nr:hypothetical protein [Escherichia coli]QNL33819.1 hypothetical protein [Salmonella enterica]CDL64084.1 hypothetical protein [Klebsiella pneumoniae IS39]